MHRFTVVWVQSALEELADLWTEAHDSLAITTAAQAVDNELSENPGSKGTEVAEGLRALVIPPIRILYSVDESKSVVEVAKIRADR